MERPVVIIANISQEGGWVAQILLFEIWGFLRVHHVFQASQARP